MEFNKLITRKCYNCNQPLIFDEFYDTNISIYDKKDIYRLWQCKHLQFYCCHCFNEIYCIDKLKTINSDNQIKFCKNCNVPITFNEYKNSYSSDPELSLRSIIDHWNNSEHVFCSKECFHEYDHRTFLELFTKNIDKEIYNLVPKEKKFMEHLMKHINQIIKQVPKVDFSINGFTVRERHILSLFLNHASMDNIPDSIENLTYLKYLYLNSNRLNYLPNSIGNLKFLRTFSTSGNYLESLPENMANLRSLRELHIENNKFVIIPKVISEINSLKYLNLSYNPIKELPDSLASLHQLKILYLMSIKDLKIPKSLKDIKRDKFMIIR